MEVVVVTSVLPERPREPELLVVGPTPIKHYVTWLTVVIALVAGAAGGFFAGRASAPEKTVTKPVAVAAPAYTTSGTVNATVAFDGTTLGYYGPAEVKAGTVMKFTLKAKDWMTTNLAVGRVDVGVTWERVSSYTGARVRTPLHLHNYSEGGMQPGRPAITITLTEGVWDVVVLSPGRSYAVTMIRATK
jgi:hypothetical protein